MTASQHFPMKKRTNLLGVRTFLEAHDMELQNAALRLGGRAALMRFHRLRRKVATAVAIDYGIRRELDWLAGLLGLENANDLDSPESICLADLDLDDPFVWTACLLLDQLDLLLQEIAPDYGQVTIQSNVNAA